MVFPTLIIRTNLFPFKVMLGNIFYLHSNLDRTFDKQTVSVSGDPDQMPRFAASDLALYSLPMSNKKTLGLYGLMCSCGPQGESVLPCSLKIMHLSPQIHEKNPQLPESILSCFTNP